MLLQLEYGHYAIYHLVLILYNHLYSIVLIFPFQIVSNYS